MGEADAMDDVEVTGADAFPGDGQIGDGQGDDGTLNGEAFGVAAVSEEDAGRVAEAVLMVATDPVPVEVLASAAGCTVELMEAACAGLCRDYEHDQRGFVLTEVAGGWRLQSHPDMAVYVKRFVLDGQSARLSAAALETLAIVAYKQPISRAQIAAIRGVGVDGVVRTLEQRGYIAEIARDPGPGQAVLFGTTSLFLEKLGLASLSALPPVASFVPDAGVVEQLEHGLRPVAPKVGDLGASGVSGDDADNNDAYDTGERSLGSPDDGVATGSSDGKVPPGGSTSDEGLIPPVAPQ